MSPIKGRGRAPVGQPAAFAEQARVNRGKVKCPKGHPYAGTNLYVDPNGHRHCKICLRDANARARRKKSGG